MLASCGGADSSPVAGDPRASETPKDTTGTADGSKPSEPSEPTPPSTSPPATGCSLSNGLKAGNRDVVITSDGRQRTARVHVPASYDAAKPTPLLLNFHGRQSNGSQQELVSETTPKADAAGFIVVYPEGFGQTWNGGLCCGQAQTQNVDDVAYTRALLDDLATKLCVDPKRVFATGLSNGAYMAHRLACELSDRIAAIGPVAGQLLTKTCTPKRPVPVMHFHGDADAIVLYEGGGGVAGVEESTKAWATRNGCATTPKETYAKGDAKCLTYGSCKDGADVTLCTISGGGHTWPGGFPVPGLGKTSQDIDATNAMWDFFTAHPMP